MRPSKLFSSKLNYVAHRFKWALWDSKNLGSHFDKHTHTQAQTIIPSLWCEHVEDSSGRSGGARQTQPPKKFHIYMRWRYRCLITKLKSAKEGQMQNCSMVVGPKLHFTDLNPTGNLKYFRVCFSKRCFFCKPFEFQLIKKNKAPFQKQHIFFLDGWTDLKSCDFLVFPSVLLPDSWWFVFYVTTVQADRALQLRE